MLGNNREPIEESLSYSDKEMLAAIREDCEEIIKESNPMTFQDILREELELEDILEEDESEEMFGALDMVISEHDEIKAEQTITDIDDFLEKFDEQVDEIIKVQKEEAMDELLEEFFSDESEIFEESVDSAIEEIEEIEDPDFEEELEMIDDAEDFDDIEENEINDEEAFSIDTLEEDN